MRWQRWIVHAVVVVAGFAMGSCSGGSAGFNVFPDSKDIELGKQLLLARWSEATRSFA